MDAISTESNSFSLPDLISTAIKIPGAKVDRSTFLAAEFANSTLSIDEIIEKGPIACGVSEEDISKKADKLIFTRTSQSSVASFAAGIPGGFAMAATIPADILQFFGMSLRLAQELSYLYGADDLWNGNELDDSKVKTNLIMYCGVMFGASGAVTGVRVLSTQIAKTALKKIPQKALTKTFWYPIIKQIGKAVGVKVTKSTVAKGVSKAIPLIGGVVSGTLNFASMMPMAKRLNSALDKATFHYSEEEYNEDIIEIESISENGDLPEKNEESVIDKVSSGIIDIGNNISSGISGFFSKHTSKPEPKEMSVQEQAEAVRQMKELLDSGLITQEEFDKKKKEILKI